MGKALTPPPLRALAELKLLFLKMVPLTESRTDAGAVKKIMKNLTKAIVESTEVDMKKKLEEIIDRR